MSVSPSIPPAECVRERETREHIAFSGDCVDRVAGLEFSDISVELSSVFVFGGRLTWSVSSKYMWDVRCVLFRPRAISRGQTDHKAARYFRHHTIKLTYTHLSVSYTHWNNKVVMLAILSNYKWCCGNIAADQLWRYKRWTASPGKPAWWLDVF